MSAVFFETSAFSALRPAYLSEDAYRSLQASLLENPEMGDLMPRTGGFRKLRWADQRRGKGKRGGLRIIYYWLHHHGQLWMFSIYDKDELENLTAEQEHQLKRAIHSELKKRGMQ
jgi:mRNA-degrading endonuclease RelE of RelBE toxin-antitoxin system